MAGTGPGGRVKRKAKSKGRAAALTGAQKARQALQRAKAKLGSTFTEKEGAALQKLERGISTRVKRKTGAQLTAREASLLKQKAARRGLRRKR